MLADPVVIGGTAALLTLAVWALQRIAGRIERRRKWEAVRDFREGIRDPRAGVGIHTGQPPTLVRVTTLSPAAYQRAMAALAADGVAGLDLGEGSLLALAVEPPAADEGLDLSLQEESRPFDWRTAAEGYLCWDERHGEH